MPPISISDPGSGTGDGFTGLSLPKVQLALDAEKVNADVPPPLSFSCAKKLTVPPVSVVLGRV